MAQKKDTIELSFFNKRDFVVISELPYGKTVPDMLKGKKIRKPEVHIWGPSRKVAMKGAKDMSNVLLHRKPIFFYYKHPRVIYKILIIYQQRKKRKFRLFKKK